MSHHPRLLALLSCVLPLLGTIASLAQAQEQGGAAGAAAGAPAAGAPTAVPPTDLAPAAVPPAAVPAPAGAPAAEPPAAEAPKAPAPAAAPQAFAAPPRVPMTAAVPPSADHHCEACAHKRRGADYMLGFRIGAGFFDLSGLNDRLAANGYERLEGPMLMLGGEGRGISRHGVVYGVHGAATIGASGDGPGVLETDWRGGYVVADLGYAPVRLRSFLLAVTAGIGGYGVSFEIADNRDVDFDDILESPRRHTELTRGGIAFALTLQMDARIPLGPVQFEHQSYVSLGLRVSGVFGPALGHWSLPDDDDAEGGPSTGLTGAYAAFVLGWGGGLVD